MINVENLTFSYSENPIIEGLSLRLKKGTITTLIGPSGSGKSTLFKLLARLLTPDSGQIRAEGKIVYLTQTDMLLPWRTVLRNVSLFSEIGDHPEPSKLARDRALDLLEEFGLKGCEKLFPDELSGGMRQRVALAQALFFNHPILLLDEPFSSLDVALREQMYETLTDIRERHGTTILMATHDFRDALSVSDAIISLKNGKITAEWEVSETIRSTPAEAASLTEAMRSEIICANEKKAAP